MEPPKLLSPPFFLRVRKIFEKRLLPSPSLSLHPSVRQHGTTGGIFKKFDI